jgi:hypothetical protein
MMEIEQRKLETSNLNVEHYIYEHSLNSRTRKSEIERVMKENYVRISCNA